jgi:hypothetical protein
MNKRLRRLAALTVFALALTSLPSTSLASPLWSPATSASQPSTAANPLRSLVNVFAREGATLWSSLDAVYSDAYVATACTPSC